MAIGKARWRAEARRKNKSHIHPITGEFKWAWKHKTAILLGGKPNTKAWQSYLDDAEIEWGLEVKGLSPNVSPIRTTVSRAPKGAPMRKRVGDSALEGDVVPEGWVYVIKNPMSPFIMKIGRTYPDGIESRLSEARRWGQAKLVAQIWFDEVNDAEREIHRMLDKYNMRTLGYTDVGKELFKCSLKDFYRAVQQHTLGIEDENAISKS